MNTNKLTEKTIEVYIRCIRRIMKNIQVTDINKMLEQMDKYQCNTRVQVILRGIRPAVLALILFAGLELAKVTVADIWTVVLFLGLVAAIRIWRKSPIFYLFVSAILGIVLHL